MCDLVKIHVWICTAFLQNIYFMFFHRETQDKRDGRVILEGVVTWAHW